MWLLARTEFAIRVVAWQRTKDGQDGRNKPEPMTPPPSRMEAQVTAATARRRAEKYMRRERRRTTNDERGDQGV